MNKRELINICAAVVFAVCLGAGCSATTPGPVVEAVPGSAAATPGGMYMKIPAEEGSIFGGGSSLLFSDQRAKRVGDTIIVDIVENASSKVDANTDISRESTVEGKIPFSGGLLDAVAASNSKFSPANIIGASTKNDFKGKGSSDRKGQITASIGASVVNVLPNGNVVLDGKREMTVNNETQYITVSGIVRPEDIGSDNHVKSTYLADAKIAYSGSGVLADKQRPGWLARIFDKIWPF